MNLKEQHKAILSECYRRQLALPKKAPPLGGYFGHFRERVRQARVDIALADEVKYGPAWSTPTWFGAYSAAERQRYRRALMDLEAAGLVKVTAGPAGKAAFVRLTPEGERIARGLAAGAKKESTGEAPAVPASADEPRRRGGPGASRASLPPAGKSPPTTGAGRPDARA